jgi:tripartite-type tricarboxylate transporter receptor subunit TctC
MTRTPGLPGVARASRIRFSSAGAIGGRPRRCRERIAADIRLLATDPAIAARVANMGSGLRVGTPAEFAAAIEEQRAKIAAIANGMKRRKESWVNNAGEASWKPPPSRQTVS